MKKLDLKLNSFVFFLASTLLVFFAISCRSEKSDSGFEYVDATVDDLAGKNFEAILIRNLEDPDKKNMIMVIGDIDDAERIIGYGIKAEKIVKTSWIEHMASDFIKAERIKRGYLDDTRAIFLTKDKGYMVKIAADDKVVYGPDYQSEQLRKDFEEIGLLSVKEKRPDMNDIIKGLKGSPTPIDPNRVMESQKRLQEQVRRLKEAKEANLPASK
jgi:hypothetical protein